MDKLEIDYSLPYEEAKKKYGHNGYFMSKDQYEAAAKQAKMNAAEEAGTSKWWEQEGGPAEEIIKNNGGVTSADIAERRLTPKQMGIQSKGTPGDDHINNSEKLDTAETTELQNEREKLYGQKDSYTPEETEAAKNEAGITKNVPGSTSANNALTDSVSEAVTPKEGDTPEENNAKGNYNKSMMSIWDAYRNKKIDKETAGYFTIDAIATLAKNLGRSIGNVGAQFSGGTIDNGHDTSMWEKRRDSMFNTELQKETEGIDTFENKFKQLYYNRNSTINDLVDAVK